MIIDFLFKRKKKFKIFYSKSFLNFSSFHGSNFDANIDYYKILEVNKSVDKNELKKSFYNLAKKYHPDMNKGDDVRFKKINQAYEILSNDQKRKEYDSFRQYSNINENYNKNSTNYGNN